jgi:Domain of unknown function (DUF4332)
MLLFNIVYAGHARGTHHKLALDALHHLASPNAEAWERVFLKYATVYMDGAKAPDDEFKDFKNHVLHVRDGYWGGASTKAVSWYQHLVDGLVAQDWERAVYAAGVLSHYYTDPIHPFHTAQSEAENSLHRAVEWSINRSYDRLRADAVAKHSGLVIEVPKGANWLADMVCQGAETSNVYYENLIAHYDIKAGVVDPPSGLDDTSRALVAKLLMYAAKGFAVILDRAFVEAKVAPPEVSLTLETVMAAVKIPLKALAKKLGDNAERRQVEAMYDELQATGRVEATLPEDDRMVRDLHAKEVLAPREKQLATARAARLLPPTSPAAMARAEAVTGRKAKKPAAPPPVSAAGGMVAKPEPRRAAEPLRSFVPPIEPARIATSAPSLTPEVTASVATAVQGAPTFHTQAREPAPPLPIREATSIREIEPIGSKPVERQPAPIQYPARAEQPPQTPPEPVRELASLQRDRTALRLNLSETDDLERAPSIGPAMADKFAGFGVMTVGDFLDQEARDLSEVLDDPRYGTNVIMSWQDQARLVTEIPGLTGTGAQLLVGAGFRSLRALQLVEEPTLCAAVLQYAHSTPGQRILRDGPPPDIEKVKMWAESARMQKAA